MVKLEITEWEKTYLLAMPSYWAGKEVGQGENCRSEVQNIASRQVIPRFLLNE